MTKKNRSPLSLKITLIALSSLAACALIVGVFSYVLHRGDTIAAQGDRALALARAAALAVDPDEFVSILQTGEKNEYWYQYKAFIDSLHQENNLLYLYVLDKNYASEVTYFAEGGADSIDLGETESVNHHDDKLFGTITTGQGNKTGPYSSEDYGSMISGFAPVKNEAGQIIGVVGADIDINDVVAASSRFGLMILGITAGLCLIAAFFMIRYMRRRVGDPMQMLSAASDKLAQGDMDVNVSIRSADEIGYLAQSFQNMIDSTNNQVAALEKISQRDLTVTITPRCGNDQMSLAMQTTVDHLNEMFTRIQSSSQEVSHGAKQVSDDAQSLAQGTTQQAAAIERFSEVIGHMADKTKENAQLAGKASVLAADIKENAEKGAQQMSQMTQAVQDINEASQAISKVMSVIDNIAFQTNILALNAAVEAARAGQHGKGFAVVAEEVRSLANKSAQAARDTSLLITNSMEKAELGARIAQNTASSLSDIVSGIMESGQIVEQIAAFSQEQSQAVHEINTGIDQIVQVIHSNSATAEQSASASEAMSAQAQLLHDLTSQFTLKDNPVRFTGQKRESDRQPLVLTAWDDRGKY